MTSLEGRTVHVAGAGAVGLSIAVELADVGAAVTVFDPSPDGNASAVAAGMLAPVFEAVLDPVSAGHFPLLMAAREAWPAFAERLGIALNRSGAVYTGQRQLAVRKAVADLGVAGEPTTEGLLVREDWSLDPEAALARLRETARGLGVAFRSEPLDAPLAPDSIAATGWQAVGWAPESWRVTPIKGQLLKAEVGPPSDRHSGPIERRDGGYIVPDPAGPLVGATMQPGLTDLEADDALSELVGGLFPNSELVTGKARVGIRGATPDGLPLVGPSVTPGVWLAMGMRRNGWLLAPLVARMTRAYLAGDDPGPWAPAMRATRFLEV